MFADADGSLRGTNTRDSLEQVLAHYESGDWRAHRVIVTGDIIQDDSAEAYDNFRDLLLPLKLRTHCVPGNHDIRDLMRPVCCRPPFSYCAYEEFRDWLLVGLDSCIKGDPGGEVSQEELDRLSEIVTRSTAKHVLVFLHHPPVPMGSKWLDSVGLRNGDEVLERLRMLGRIRGVLFGHVHQDYDDDYEGMRILATPSTCAQFKPGSEKFEVDDKPPAYRRVVLSSDGAVDSELVWMAD